MGQIHPHINLFGLACIAEVIGQASSQQHIHTQIKGTKYSDNQNDAKNLFHQTGIVLHITTTPLL